MTKIPRAQTLFGEPSAPRTTDTRLPAGVQIANYDKPIKRTRVCFETPDRPKSCLEVDFPIGPINALAQLEINAKKPIYEMGKWWARRQSSVFRAMLIAAAMEAPDDPNDADREVWESYYANHQAAGNFDGIKVLDPFMGGGTTLVEGARLGFDVVGVDLNPIAWFVTKTELSGTDPTAVRDLFTHVETGARPHITPFTVTTCPRGHVGRWFKADDPACPFDRDEARDAGYELVPQPVTFDIHSIADEQRDVYRYEGPEIVYTFWSKHGECSRDGHRTPVLRSPVVAVKDLTVKAVTVECPRCHGSFDWEFDQARMAPAEPLVNAPDESPYIAPPAGAMTAPCPQCGAAVSRPGEQGSRRKKVNLTLLVHPRWMKGVAGSDVVGERGGWAGASSDEERRWIEARTEDLTLVEVRGSLPTTITDPLDSARSIETDRGTARRTQSATGDLKIVDSSFVCGQCGTGHDFLTEVKKTGHTAPAYPYVLQGYCPECDREHRPYNGRFFKVPDARDRDSWLAAVSEWHSPEAESLRQLVPAGKLPFAHMTHDLNGGIPNWGYTHWWKMFNPRQLLTHARLVQAISAAPERFDQRVRETALNAFQQYLRNQNMFCFWNPARDTPEPFFSNNNYHPKATVIENGCFSTLGRGNFRSCADAVISGLEWAIRPWEKAKAPEGAASKGVQLPMSDSLTAGGRSETYCGSSTDLSQFPDCHFDLVITDPPFGGNVFYADLADFFYVWLREPLSAWYPEIFAPEQTNKVQEAITNPAEHPDNQTREEKRAATKEGLEKPADEFYRETLTECWAESARVLKDGGILAFTFHHNEDQAWIGVLRSLFDAGLVLVATYPIRSDESKGENAAFGSRKIEFDIIHVCRKRLETPQRVSWARMRLWMQEELNRLHGLLQHYQARSLSEADVRVILRGKALEYYSSHYGQIFTGEDEPLDITQALIGINEILEEERLPAADRPPDTAEPLTALYLRIFKETTELPRDEISKLLKGTGAAPQQFHERGWTVDENKAVRIVPVQIRFEQLRKLPRAQMKSDLDQVHFLIGAALPGSNVAIQDELQRQTFRLKPSVPDILNWLAEREPDRTLRDAARRASNLVQTWLAGRSSDAQQAQLSLFDTPG